MYINKSDELMLFVISDAKSVQPFAWWDGGNSYAYLDLGLSQQVLNTLA